MIDAEEAEREGYYPVSELGAAMQRIAEICFVAGWLLGSGKSPNDPEAKQEALMQFKAYEKHLQGQYNAGK